MRAIRFVVSLIVLVACGCASTPLDRVSVIGASVSAGVGASVVDGKEKRPVDLADALTAAGAVKGETGPRVGKVTSHADPMYFMNPGTIGDKQLKEALAESPGCVIALDDLFWYVYGPAKSDAERLERLDKRLASLEAVKGPLVIGDVPDMSSAYPGMLSKEQIAPEAARVEANVRIRAWAAARPNVALVALSDVVAGAKAGRVKIGDQELAGDEAMALIGPDRLHASAEGLAAIAILTLDAVEQIRGRKEKAASRPLPSLRVVGGRLRPRPKESGGWMELLDMATEFKRTDDAAQKVGIELAQAVDFAREGRAERVAEVLPELWVRELRSRSFFSTGQIQREMVYQACEKAGVDVKSKMAPVREALVQKWRMGNGNSAPAVEIVVLDRLMGEPRRDLEILRTAAMMESSAVEGGTPALDEAWRIVNDNGEDGLGDLAVVFANPTGAMRRSLESYKSFADLAGKKGSYFSEKDVQERRAQTLRRAGLLAMALDQAGRGQEAKTVRDQAEGVLGERPEKSGPPELWIAKKQMEPSVYRTAYLRALRKHLGLDASPGVDLVPTTWDSAYSSAAADMDDRATTDEALRLVKEWKAGAKDLGQRRRAIELQLMFEDALGMEPTVIDELAALRVNVEARKGTDDLAHKVIEVAAKRGSAAKAAALFDDYQDWPERVKKELVQLEKNDTGLSKWISNESSRYTTVRKWGQDMRNAAVCLKAAGRGEEAELLLKKAEEIRWKEPEWARK